MALFHRRTDTAPGGLFLVAGLGNPGDEYAGTRHNAGFLVAGRFIKKHGMMRPRRRYSGRWTEGEALEKPVAVLMPQTFMNCSGESVAEAARKKHIPAEKIIVIHDDLDFPFGAVRCRRGGGTGGHNGLASVVNSLGSADFCRVRMGIGRPDDPGTDPKDWVLSPFGRPDEEISALVDLAVECVEVIISEGIDAAMGRFNRREAD